MSWGPAVGQGLGPYGACPVFRVTPVFLFVQIAFVATRFIERGEQLGFNYGVERSNEVD